MIRATASFALIFALLASANAFADSNSGCLATSPPITWTLPSTPGTPNWTLNSVGLKPTVPISTVPFSATFWRRPECASQLLMTLDNSHGAFELTPFSVFQNGQWAPLLNLIVNDPAIYGLPLLELSAPPPITISGIVDFPDNIDASQAMTIDYTPVTLAGQGSVVSIQIPAAAATTPPPFTIGPGMTGQWFDPNESGHGFGIEVLPGNQMLAEWFVFAPTGGPTWILGTGPITGNTAVLTAIQSAGSGGLFPPNFNQNQVQNVPWGTISFTFSDCNNGIASWQPTAAGYTAGSIPITRLTLPAGLSCQ